MNNIPYLLTATSITVILDGRSHTVLSSSAARFVKLKHLLKHQKFDEIPAFFSSEVLVDDWNEGPFSIDNGQAFYTEMGYKTKLPEVLSSRIYELHLEGVSFKPALNFYKRLMSNPSSRAVEEFYNFLEKKNLPIDNEGYVYAYKAIRDTWYDIHSNKFLNTIGSVLEMPRNKVDDNKDRHCSHGFHVGSLEYVKWYGGANSKYVICKFDPKDVVSVPQDHNCQKVRVCRYEVVSEYDGPLPDTIIGNQDYSATAEEIAEASDSDWTESWGDEEDEEYDEEYDEENDEE